MKKLILLILITTSCATTKSKKFKAGAEIFQIEKSENYKKPTSVLVEFLGHTHSIYFYSDLAKRLKRQFKRKSIKVDFNYILSAKNPFEKDVNLIPKTRYEKGNYNLVCKISFPKYEKIGGSFEFSKLNFKLNFRVLKKSKIQLKSVLNVNTYKTILTQNRKLSKLIVKLITEEK